MRVLHTGDVVDNWENHDGVKIGIQVEQDYVRYRAVVDLMLSRGHRLIDIAGNHDHFAVGGFGAPEHYVLRYNEYYRVANVTRVEDFWLARTVLDDFEVVVLSLYQFPNVRSLFAFRVSASQYLLDILEQELNVPRLAKYRIVISHFPLSCVYNGTRSSLTGSTFTDLLANSDIDFVLTGHSHPEIPVFQHHKGMLEVIGPDIMDHQRYGFLTFDRDQMVYHHTKIDELLVGAVTYPIPKEQLNQRSTFNRQNTEIRVVVFSEDQDLAISVSGAVTGDLQFQRIVSPNLSLYSMPLNLPPGEYSIDFSGDFNSSLTFMIGDSALLDPEYYTDNWWWMLGLDYMAVLGWFGLVIATLPCVHWKLGDAINDWIENDGDTAMMFKAIAFAPFGMRTRLAKLTSTAQTILCALVLSPLVIPFGISTVNDHLYWIFIGGYFVDLRYYADYYSGLFAVIYFFATIFPHVVIFSGLTIEPTSTMAVGRLWLFIGVIGDIIFAALVVATAITLWPTVFNPIFSIVPIAMLLYLYWYVSGSERSLNWRHTRDSLSELRSM
jgi:hypothetical protein